MQDEQVAMAFRATWDFTAARVERVAKRMEQLEAEDRLPYRTWEDVLWDTQIVLRSLSRISGAWGEVDSTDPFYALADQVDAIHSHLMFRREQLGRESDTIPMPLKEDEEAKTDD